MIESINTTKADLNAKLESKPEGYSTAEEVAKQCGILVPAAEKLLAVAVRKGTVEKTSYSSRVVAAKVVKTAVYRSKVAKATEEVIGGVRVEVSRG